MIALALGKCVAELTDARLGDVNTEVMFGGDARKPNLWKTLRVDVGDVRCDSRAVGINGETIPYEWKYAVRRNLSRPSVEEVKSAFSGP